MSIVAEFRPSHAMTPSAISDVYTNAVAAPDNLLTVPRNGDPRFAWFEVKNFDGNGGILLSASDSTRFSVVDRLEHQRGRDFSSLAR